MFSEFSPAEHNEQSKCKVALQTSSPFCRRCSAAARARGRDEERVAGPTAESAGAGAGGGGVGDMGRRRGSDDAAATM